MSALAARDAEILRLDAAGVARRGIADQLGVTKNIVDNVIGAVKRTARAAGEAGVANGGKQAGLAAPRLPIADLPTAPGAALSVYESACVAIEAARSVDEAKEIADQAEAMRVYARQAKNRGLEVDAAEIRIRAERRLGELIGLQKAGIGLNRGTAGQGRPRLGGASGEPPKEEVSSSSPAGAPRRWRRASGFPSRLIRGEAQATKAERRGAREAALAGKILALPDKRYGVILADPEWRFEPYSRQSGMDRAADNHYPTSATEAIAARPVADIAAENCVLFLWATVPMLPQALAVMAAWGFDYRSHFVWVKERLGTGYWNRNVHELLLLGVKGDVPAPAPGTQETSVIFADVLAHSQKPAIFAELIERYFPSLPKIELNRRGPPRPGWDAWGDEVPPEQAERSDAVANGGEESLEQGARAAGEAGVANGAENERSEAVANGGEEETALGSRQSAVGAEAAA